MSTATYSHLRENLAEIWNQVEDTQEPVIVKRRGHQDMAILPADELESLRETAHLLRSPRNARRLLEAIARAVEGNAEKADPATLRQELEVKDADR
jgi:antitoxin YefM